MGPYGSKIFKTLLLPQITLEYVETSFLTICFFKNVIVAYGEIKNLNYLENERS